MQTITIHGRRTLHGSIRPAAAKNSTLPLLAAAGRMLPCRVRLPWMVIVCMRGAS